MIFAQKQSFLIIALPVCLAVILGLLIPSMEYRVIYAAVGLVGGVLALFNAYIGVFLVIITQPVFISSWHGAGLGFSKMIYGVLFAVWFGGWFLSKLLQRNFAERVMWHPLARPTLAFAGVLALALPTGYYFGATSEDIIRDLSPYVGYLALLPVVDAVRSSHQAKKILAVMAAIGLPSFLLSYLVWTSRKLGLPYVEIPFLTYGASYWGPFSWAIWAVALSGSTFLLKGAAWGWITCTSLATLFAGYRGQLVNLICGSLIAFLVSRKLKYFGFTRYLLLFCIVTIIVVVVAGTYGLVRLPLPEKSLQRYSTLLSGSALLEDISIQGRISEATALWEAFQRNPLFGVGFGYHLEFPWPSGVWKDTPWFQYHNGYLETLMKFGALGAFVLVWYFISVIIMAYRVMQTAADMLTKAMAFGILVWLCTALTGSLAGSAFSNRGFTLTLGVLAGLLPALAKQHPIRAHESRK